MSDVHTIPRDQWRPGNKGDGTRTATVRCPDCERWESSSGHEISADGTVRPSLDCGYDDCGFHKWVRLEGWAA